MIAAVNAKQSFLQHRLAGTGATGNNAKAAGERRFDCLTLFGCQTHLQTAFLTVELMVQITISAGILMADLIPDQVGKLFFGFCRLFPINTAFIGPHSAIKDEAIGTGCDHLIRKLRRLQSLLAGCNEAVPFHTQISVAFRISQCVEDTLIHTFGRQSVDPHTHGDLICRLEAHAGHFAELIRMVLYDIHRLFSIFFVKLYGTVRRDPVRRQKGYHITSTAVGEVGIADFFEFILTDTGDGQKFFRLFVQHLQCHIPKCIIDTLRHFRTDAFDLPGREIGDDAFPGRNDLLLVSLDIILNAVFGILAPVPTHFIAHITRSRQAVPNGLDLCNGVAAAILQFLARTVKRYHKACRIRRAGTGRIDHFFKLA